MPALSIVAADILRRIIIATDQNTGHLITDATIEASGDMSVVNSTTGGKTKLKTTPDNPANLDVALSAVKTAIEGLGSPTISGDLAIVNSATGGKTVIATSNTILTAVEDQATHYLAVRDSVLDTLLGTTLYDATTHYISVKDGPLNTLLGTTLYDQTTHFIGTKDGALNTLLGTTLYDQTAHWIGTKDVALAGCISNSQVAVALSSQAFTNAVISAVEDQTTHYLAVKEVTAPAYPVGATPWAITGDGTAAAAKTLTKAAGGGAVQHYITAIEVAISAAAAANDIAILLESDAGGTPVSYWKEVIGTAAVAGSRAGISFARPIVIPANKTADLVVAAGGAGVVITTNMQGYSI